MARTRGARKAPAAEVASVQALVDDLIKENRRLKSELAKAASSGVTDLRKIAGLIRRTERGLVEAATAKRAPSGRPSRPRRPVSEETRQKRLAALAKARAARALNAQSKLITIEETRASSPGE